MARIDTSKMEPPLSQERKTHLFAALVVFVWLITTYLFWTGYVGSADDKNYAHYAFLLNRPPMNWWEFRMPFILAMKASFLLLGPSELAAVAPNLVVSLGIMAAVAWFTGWWNKPTWQTLAAVLLVVTVPLGVGFRSTALAPFFAGGLLIMGTACFLRGSPGLQMLGSALLAAGYATHEVAFFYVAILCVTSLVFDRKRYWRPVLLCIAFAVGVVLTEGVVYKILLNNPLARFQTSSAALSDLRPGYDASSGIYGVRFYTWPLENLIVSKHFGFDLILLLVTGALSWRRLVVEQRILLLVTFLTWAYLGYGTLEPWKYQPLYRQMHYYIAILFGVAALLPWTLTLVAGKRERLAQAAVGVVLVMQLVCCAGGGHWGQSVGVSRTLLAFAKSHSEQTFLTDKNSMDEMYMMNGFQLPANVICLNGPEVEQYLLVNEEPPGKPRYRFPEIPVNGILINHEAAKEPGFVRYTEEHRGAEQTLMPLSYKPMFRPLLSISRPRGFMIKSQGGGVIWSDQAVAR